MPCSRTEAGVEPGISGVSLRPLRTHQDDRGSLTELMRLDWLGAAPRPVQWNFVRSRANVLRGVHLHLARLDFLVVVEGEARIGLVDLRPDSPTFRRTEVVPLQGDRMCLLTIQSGVAHGFYFPGPTAYFYGLSHNWDPVEDEFGCRWNDPELALQWGIAGQPALSPRDAAAGSLAEMLASVAARTGCGSA